MDEPRSVCRDKRARHTSKFSVFKKVVEYENRQNQSEESGIRTVVPLGAGGAPGVAPALLGADPRSALHLSKCPSVTLHSGSGSGLVFRERRHSVTLQT